MLIIVHTVHHTVQLAVGIYITRVFTNQSLISYTNWRFSQNNSGIDDSGSDTNSFNCMLSS